MKAESVRTVLVRLQQFDARLQLLEVALLMRLHTADPAGAEAYRHALALLGTSQAADLLDACRSSSS